MSPPSAHTAGSTMRVRAANVPWSEEHLLIALNFYSKIPFGKLHKTNPAIVNVAGRMGRLAGSLAMKLSNLASLDPVLMASGRKGLPSASVRDGEMWKGFQDNGEVLGPRSEGLLHSLLSADDSEEIDVGPGDRIMRRTIPIHPFGMPPIGPSEMVRLVTVRRGQNFFRGAVFAAYESSCCITGIPEPRLLEAAHIKSWVDAPDHRFDPRNGLCMSVLHHTAFDAGLITLDASSLALVLSSHLREHFPQAALEDNFLRYEGKPIRRARQIAEPNPAFLDFHRREKFVV